MELHITSFEFRIKELSDRLECAMIESDRAKITWTNIEIRVKAVQEFVKSIIEKVDPQRRDGNKVNFRLSSGERSPKAAQEQSC